jgi:hypothetical protein
MRTKLPARSCGPGRFLLVLVQRIEERREEDMKWKGWRVIMRSIRVSKAPKSVSLRTQPWYQSQGQKTTHFASKSSSVSRGTVFSRSIAATSKRDDVGGKVKEHQRDNTEWNSRRRRIIISRQRKGQCPLNLGCLSDAISQIEHRQQDARTRELMS